MAAAVGFLFSKPANRLFSNYFINYLLVAS